MGRFSINEIKAREILDSRGNPTVEVEVLTRAGLARASVPSGASTGRHEALELRDGGRRYGGMGVLKAVGNVNKIIAPVLQDRDVRRQERIDEELVELDGTGNRSKLGANALLGVSMAVCRAAAIAKREPLYRHISFLAQNRIPTLPVPMILVLEGGKHADGSSDIQEFMIMPHKERLFRERLRVGAEVYHKIAGVLREMRKDTNVGFEGAYGPSLGTTEDVLQVIMKGIRQAGYAPGKEVSIALDSAASEFFRGGAYRLDGRKFGTDELVEWYADLVSKYPIISLEDPFAEDDWHGFAAVTERLGGDVAIVGDDLLVTNAKRVRKAIEMEACNGLLLKPNQIGTVSEAVSAARMAFDNKWKVMVSQRGGETCDPFIADLSVGLGTGFIKSGAPCRSERLAKYNRLLRIEEEMSGGK